jgi:hypothetical protein
MDPLGITALNAVREHVTSAQPGAPVVAGKARRRTARPPRTDSLRRALASGLHRLAQKLEPNRAAPRHTDTCQPAT